MAAGHGQRAAAATAAVYGLCCLLQVVVLTTAATVAAQDEYAVGATRSKARVSRHGTFQYDVPLVLPPGTNRIFPELLLRVGVRNKRSGIVGADASLVGLASITPCPRTIVQDGYTQGVLHDASDVYCLDGADRLVSVAGEYGADGTEYRTEIDHASKIVSTGQICDSPESWTVYTKSGLIMEFGLTDDARVTDDAVCNVLSWKISRVSDRHGNYWDAGYIKEDSEVRIDTIRYTGNARAGTNPYNTIQFSYEDKPDRDVWYTGGASIVTKSRLTNVAMLDGDLIARSYSFTYQDTETQCAPAITSRVSSVMECGVNNSACFPPTDFEWDETCAVADMNMQAAGSASIRTPLDQASADLKCIDFADFDGNGILDKYTKITTDDGTATPDDIQLSHGDGTFTTMQGPSTLVRDLPLELTSIDTMRVGVVDFNGDGFADVYEIMPNDDNDLPVADVIHVNDRQGGFVSMTGAPTDICSATCSDEEMQLDVSRVKYGDFNGDSLMDVYYATSDDDNGNPQSDLIYLQTTSGDMEATPIQGALTQIASLPIDTASVDVSRLRTQDIDGDKRADIYFIQGDDHDTTTVDVVWMSRSGEGSLTDVSFEQLTGAETPGVSVNWGSTDVERYKFGDFNRDGLLDVYYVTGDSGTSEADVLHTNRGDGTYKSSDGLVTTISSVVDQASVGIGAMHTIDWNNDGFLDIYVAQGFGTETAANDVVYLGDSLLSFSTSVSAAPASLSSTIDAALVDLNRFRFADVDGDTTNDLLYLVDGDCTAYVNSAAEATLNKVTNGMGVTTSIEHTWTTDESVYTRDNNAAFPLQDTQRPAKIVSAFTTTNAIGSTNRVSYSYKGSKTHVQGFGVLGFETVQNVQEETMLRTTSTYSMDYTRRTHGMAASGLREALDADTGDTSTVLSEHSAEFNSTVLSPVGDLPARFAVYVNGTQEVHNDLDGTWIRNTSASVLADEYGNNLLEDSSTVDAFAMYTSYTVKEYYPYDFTAWFVGQLAESTVTVQRGDADPITHVSMFAYDADTGVMVFDTADPGTEFERNGTYVIDLFGNKQQSTDSGADVLPATSTFTFDERGQFPTRFVNALGHTEDTVYDTTNGHVLSFTDANGLVTSIEYDALGRIEVSAFPDQTTSTVSRFWCSAIPEDDAPVVSACPDTALWIKKLVSVDDVVSYDFYDLLGLMVAHQTVGQDGAPVFKVREYDSLSRLIKESDPFFADSLFSVDTNQLVWTTYTYDVLNRVTVKTHAGITTTTTAYSGPQTWVTNALDQTSTRVVNALGDMISATDALGGEIQYTSNSQGQVTDLTHADPVSGAPVVHISAEYDLLGHRTLIHDADKGTWQTTYDVRGQLVSLQNSRGQSTVTEYDLLGRRTKVTSDEGVSTMTWDSAELGIGKPALVVGPDASYAESFEYVDPDSDDGVAQDGRVKRIHYHYDYDGDDTDIQTVQISYNKFGVESVVYPSGLLSTVNYDTLSGFRTGVTLDDEMTETWQAVEREARGFVTLERLGTSVWNARSYDDFGRVLCERATTSAEEPLNVDPCASGSDDDDSSTVLFDTEYTYDDLGNIVARLDAMRNTETTYKYDDLNRLVEQNDGIDLVKYEHDSIGRITHQSGVGTFIYCEDQGSDCPKAIQAIVDDTGSTVDKFGTDAGGNVVSTFQYTSAYNSYDKTTSITTEETGDAVSFSYNANHDMYESVETDSSEGTTTTTRYAGASFQDMLTTDMSTGQTTRKQRNFVGSFATLVNDVDADGHVTDGKLYMTIQDVLGSVVAIVDEDGNLQDQRRFDAYGQCTLDGGYVNTTIMDRGFTNHQVLKDGDLVQTNARVFYPRYGTFLSADSQIQFPDHTQSLYRYAYAMNAPLSRIDPTGHGFGSWCSSAWHSIEHSVEHAVTKEIQKLEAEAENWLRGAADNLISSMDAAATTGCGVWCLVVDATIQVAIYKMEGESWKEAAAMAAEDVIAAELHIPDSHHIGRQLAKEAVDGGLTLHIASAELLHGAVTAGLGILVDHEQQIDEAINTYASEHANLLTNYLSKPTVQAVNGFLEGAEKAAEHNGNILQGGLAGAKHAFKTEVQSELTHFAKAQFYKSTLGADVKHLLNKEHAMWHSFRANMLSEYHDAMTQVSHFAESLRNPSWGRYMPLSAHALVHNLHKNWEALAHSHLATTLRQNRGVQWAVSKLEDKAKSKIHSMVQSEFDSLVAKASVTRTVGLHGLVKFDSSTRIFHSAYLGDVYFVVQSVSDNQIFAGLTQSGG